MDPITAAFVAALSNLAEPVIKDAYEGLKGMIVRKLGAKHGAVEAVENLERKPDSAGRRETLSEEIAASPAMADAEILAAAQALLESVKARGGHTETVRQHVTGDRNIFSGTGDIHLGGKSP